MKKIGAVLGICVVFAACGRPPAVAAASGPDRVAEKAKADRAAFLWDRRKDCAARASHVVGLPEWTRPAQGISVMNSENHYNESMDRCFLKIAMTNRGASTKDGIPLFTYTVFDAFDNSSYLSCTDQPRADASFCPVAEAGKEDVYDCGRCRSLAKTLMSQ